MASSLEATRRHPSTLRWPQLSRMSLSTSSRYTLTKADTLMLGLASFWSWNNASRPSQYRAIRSPLSATLAAVTSTESPLRTYEAMRPHPRYVMDRWGPKASMAWSANAPTLTRVFRRTSSERWSSRSSVQ